METFLPEWQIQEVLARNPKLLEMPGRFEGIRVRGQQRYLPSTGGYIDLLCRPRTPRGWLVVEIKANPIDNPQPGLQVLKYKKGLATELKSRPDEIHCMVAAPGPLPPDVEKWYSDSHIAVRLLDLENLARLRLWRPTGRLGDAEEDHVDDLVRRRLASLSRASLQSIASKKSVRQWVIRGGHDKEALTQLGSILLWLSENAPLFSHEVGLPPSRLDDFASGWFWLFYSAMDRRGNAALFIRGRKQLEESQLFFPSELVKLVFDCGETEALRTVSSQLARAGVPLIVDLQFGRNSLAKSIVDAAFLVGGFGNDFDRMFRELQRANTTSDLGTFLVRRISQAVHGMGPRSAAQFVRGMALKGPWKVPLTSSVFLEDTKYNAMFAGPARLTIAIADYRKEAAEFADEYLGGDKGILSHALWYIRKRYCDKTPLCFECPVAGYCAYYRESFLSRRGRKSYHSSGNPVSVRQSELIDFPSP